MFDNKPSQAKDDRRGAAPPLSAQGEKLKSLPEPPVEIREVPANAMEATLLHAMHLEDQGKLESVLGPSLGNLAQRSRRMQQVAAVAAGDTEKIKLLERQDDAFRLDNIARRRNPGEMLDELRSISASGQPSRIDAGAWFAAECLLSKPPVFVVEAAIGVLELASQFSGGAAQRINVAAPLVKAACGKSRSDLFERFSVIKRRAQ